ncbi:hypothetical protein PENDEC_c039G03001 [Penicillium decumbens]|uniref:Uncharacterized protein n=1 Tax=Penicillium decumbens TaxID=69771 RepID=A0A1V6NRE6_PENDC|nr:hypothetical protein PENDEC_c039G03001 [Penicillium decumbens]
MSFKTPSVTNAKGLLRKRQMERVEEGMEEEIERSKDCSQIPVRKLSLTSQKVYGRSIWGTKPTRHSKKNMKKAKRTKKPKKAKKPNTLKRNWKQDQMEKKEKEKEKTE